MPSKKTKSKRPVVRRTSPTSCSPIPCPFCGKRWASLCQTNETKAWFVFCNNCLSNGPIIDDVNEALVAWGKRANPAVEGRTAKGQCT
jgi:transcription elongation factor Elf1